MKIIAAAIAMAVLASSANAKSADGYDFDRKEWTWGEFTVRVIEHPTFEALRDAAQRKGQERSGYMAFAEIDKKNKICKLHIVSQKFRYTPEFIGHEIAHCIYGNFHKEAFGEK